MSKPSTALLFAMVTIVAMTGQQTFGQAAAPAAGAANKDEYSKLAVNPNFKPIDPAVVASNEAAAAADALRTRDRNIAYNNARKVLASQNPLDDAGKKTLDAWYKEYFLPSFTLPETRGELPELRDTLLNKDLRPARSAAAIAYLRLQVLSYMNGFAQSRGKYNFHPAVRYNAMLLIGSLNEVEYGKEYSNGQKAYVPDPLLEALDLMIAEFKSPTQIDAVRVAALVGIDRHVKLDLARPADRHIPGAKKLLIFNEMIALLNASPPAGRSAEGHTWMQRRAIDILAVLGTVGTKAEANAALEKIVADKDAPISLRCTASEALAQWVPNSKEKIDASTVSQNLGLIAVKACKDELVRIAALVTQEADMKKLQELIKKSNPAASGQFGAADGGGGGAGMGMGMGGGGEGYGGGDSMPGGMESMSGGAGGMGMFGGALGGAGAEIPTDPRIIWSRRRLKYQLTCVKHGLAGMKIAGKSTPHEKVVDEVATAVELALALTDPPAEKPDLEGLTESIQKGVLGFAFLTPEAAEIGVDPVTDLLLGAEPVTPVVPDATAAPAVDPTAPPADGTALPGLPPSVE
ncbi:MAG: hypothetical protein O3C40_04930 [Planctomycetota bacterium]|nr:hypothetical protein [Planctomycetota bacterium]